MTVVVVVIANLPYRPCYVTKWHIGVNGIMCRYKGVKWHIVSL